MSEAMRCGLQTVVVVLGLAAGSIACGLTLVGGAASDDDGIGGGSGPSQGGPLDKDGGLEAGSGEGVGVEAGAESGEPPCEAGFVRSCASSGGAGSACDDAKQTCVGGVFGACVGASVSPETCNGIDDNCNNTVDDPCPNGVALGATTASSPLFGHPTNGSSLYDDTCPAGEVLIGLTTKTNSYLRQIQGHCGKITVVEDKTSVPYSYSITVTAGTSLPNHGTMDGTSDTITCPSNAVVVGASGRGNTLVDQLSLRCAPLSMTTGPSTSFGLNLGATTTIGPTGGSGGNPIALFSCPSGTIVNRINGKTGDGVDSVRFPCATPTITRNAP